MSQVRLTKKYTLRVTMGGPPNSPNCGTKYNLEIVVSGNIDKHSGLIINRDKLDKIIFEKILSKYDKAHLNNFLEFPTGELLAHKILEELKTTELSGYFSEVHLTKMDGTGFKATQLYQFH